MKYFLYKILTCTHEASGWCLGPCLLLASAFPKPEVGTNVKSLEWFRHLRSCPGAWHHAHSWWTASQLAFLRNENIKEKSEFMEGVPALDPRQSFLRGWAESPRESGLQVRPQPTPATKFLFSIPLSQPSLIRKGFKLYNTDTYHCSVE